VLIGEATITNFKVFGLTRPVLEPRIYDYTIDAICPQKTHSAAPKGNHFYK
jgi:hypothetical protein